MKKARVIIIRMVALSLVLICALTSCGFGGSKGEKGDPGKDGVDGKSAYELAVDNGYTGTLSEWLESLAGEANGTAGKSAYEIAVEKGYKGTETEWLQSLVGEPGEKGEKGDSGENGKSAYELAVQNGFEGSLTEWLQSLIGAPGENGINGERGENGQRGTGILRVSSATTSASGTGPTGIPIKYKIALSTVKSEANVDEVFVGDFVNRSVYLYPVAKVDENYVYLGAYTSLKGSAGAKGADGYTPVKGTDYYTDADKAEMVEAVKDSMDGIPDYWQTELDEGVAEINAAVEAAGRNKSAFLFYTDAHWGYGSGMSPALLKYLGKHTAINKTIFGGDFGNTYEYPDTGKTMDDWAEVMRSWKLAVRDIPNHHSVVGNHDKDVTAFSTDKALYGFLFAPEETGDIVRGGDFFYYIDEPNEQTRYFYLNSGLTNFSDEQAAFLIEHMTSVPSGWHIVAAAHIWFVYDSTDDPTVGSVPENHQKILDLFDAYNNREKGSITVDSEAHTYDFSACEGFVEFCIGGHTHVDYNFTTETGIPVILCCTDSQHLRGNDYTYTAGTTTESAVSGIVADYDAGKISVLRVGRGESYVVPINRIEPVKYTNVLTLAVDKDGNPFNGGKGWAGESRIGSGGIYMGGQTGENANYVTGHIPFTVGIDNVIRLKNVTFDGTTHNNYKYMVAFFDSSFARVNTMASGGGNAIYSTDLSNYGASNNNMYAPVMDGNNIVQFRFTSGQITNTAIKYIAICCSYLGDDSIITINEPIE